MTDLSSAFGLDICLGVCNTIGMWELPELPEWEDAFDDPRNVDGDDVLADMKEYVELPGELYDDPF